MPVFTRIKFIWIPDEWAPAELCSRSGRMDIKVDRVVYINSELARTSKVGSERCPGISRSSSANASRSRSSISERHWWTTRPLTTTGTAFNQLPFPEVMGGAFYTRQFENSVSVSDNVTLFCAVRKRDNLLYIPLPGITWQWSFIRTPMTRTGANRNSCWNLKVLCPCLNSSYIGLEAGICELCI